MNIKHRIWLAPVLACAVFALGISAVWLTSTKVSGALDRLETDVVPGLKLSTALAGQLQSVHAIIQGAVTEGEKKRLEEADAEAASIRKTLAGLRSLEPDSAQLAALQKAFETYYAASKGAALVMLGAAPGDSGSAVRSMREGKGQLDQAMRASDAQLKEGLDATFALGRTGTKAMFAAIIVTATIVLASLVTGALLTVRVVWRQLGAEPEYARRCMQDVAAGNLSVEIQVAPGDRDSLLASLNEMAQGLRGIVAEIRQGTDAILMASGEIAAGNQDLSQRTELSAAQLERTSAHMHELTERVESNAASARQSDELAGRAVEVSRRGAEDVNDVVASIGRIQTSSGRIAEITSMIDGIAFQTNILALNAAVEAARAGEQGRGFAVVAQEVRTLSRRSAEAAKEIGRLIGESVSEVERGHQLAQRAGKTMMEIDHTVAGARAAVGEITAVTADQVTSIQRVGETIRQIDQATQQNAALVEQAAAASTSLRERARELAAAVARFRLEPPVAVPAQETPTAEPGRASGLAAASAVAA